jgi:uncharacterized membrane protein
MSSYEFRALAREQMKNRYWMVFIATLVVSAVSAGTSAIAVGFLLIGPLSVGLSYYLLDYIENKNNGDKFELLIEGLKKSLVNSIVAGLLNMVFVFLWSLLFIIPGIIKALAYRMYPYIIADNPEIDAMEALRRSEEMMRGNKTRLLALYISFIGWFILSAFTFGIGLFFLMPYIQTSVANFYVDLRGPKVKYAEFTEK